MGGICPSTPITKCGKVTRSRMWTLVVIGAGVLVLQSAAIAALLIQRGGRLRAQAALRENQRRYRLHDLYHDYLRAECSDLPAAPLPRKC